MDQKVTDKIWNEATAAAVEESEGAYRKPTQGHAGIVPTEFKVLIKPEDVGDKFEGSSILRPDTVKERDQYAAMKGTLVAVSPLAFTYENWPEGERKPQVGDRVIFAKYAGATVKGADDVEYRLVNDKDVAAILV